MVALGIVPTDLDPRVSERVEENIRRLRQGNPKMGILKIAAKVGCGVSVVQRVLATP
jgi:hypothetical protein